LLKAFVNKDWRLLQVLNAKQGYYSRWDVEYIEDTKDFHDEFMISKKCLREFPNVKQTYLIDPSCYRVHFMTRYT